MVCGALASFVGDSGGGSHEEDNDWIIAMKVVLAQFVRIVRSCQKLGQFLARYSRATNAASRTKGGVACSSYAPRP